MNDPKELSELERRIGALEYEVGQLRLRLNSLRAGAIEPVTHPATEPPLATPSAIPPAPPSIGIPAGVSAPLPAEPTAVPPLLPPPHAAAPAGEPPVIPPETPKTTPWRDWLEPLQLWPPSGEQNAEVRLAAWWATRMGALLAVIGIVFLGIYVSRDSAPWVRLLEVSGVTAGVLLLGRWLERRLPKFGAVVFGAGLALTYFCAFAAYAVPPMKVLTSPGAALAWQLAAITVILAIAWRRDSQVVATMAVALGHVTAFVALRHAPDGFGPWVVLALGVVGVFLWLARRWEAPSGLAMPLAWLFLVVAAGPSGPRAPMPLPQAWTWAGLFYALYFVRDVLSAARGRELARVDRTLQVVNSSLAVAVGLFLTAQVGGDRFEQFYFGAGALLAVGAFVWQRWPTGGALAPIFYCKAAGLFALGVIAAFDGHARYLVLLAQAFVMLVSAVRSHVRGLRIATVVVGLVALSFYVAGLRAENAPFRSTDTLVEIVFLVGAAGFAAAAERWLRLPPAVTALAGVVLGAVGVATISLWSAAGWQPALLVAFGACAFATAAALRGFRSGALLAAVVGVAAHVQLWWFDLARYPTTTLWGNQAALLGAFALTAAGLRRWTDAGSLRQLHGALLGLAGATLIVVCFKAFSPPQALALAAALGALLAGGAAFAPRWPLAAVAGPLLALAVVLHSINPAGGEPGWLVLAAALAWVSPLVLAASAAHRETILSPRWAAGTPALQTALATWVTVLALRENLSGGALVLAASGTALLVFSFQLRPGLRPALEASWALWGLVLLAVVDRGAHGSTWGAVVLSWAPAVAMTWIEGLAQVRTFPPPWRRWSEGVQVAIAVLISLAVAFDHTGPERLWAFVGITALAYAASRWGRVSTARSGLVVVAGLAWCVAWWAAQSAAAQGWTAMLFAVLVVAAMIAILPLISRADDHGRRMFRWEWLAAALAFVLAGYAFVQQRGPVAPYATVGIGGMAVALFLLGLFVRSRPHRLVGLAGLALCIPRAFLVDLDSTLHRIAAFVALGAVLLWVGFSYHRFRHLIVEEDKNP